MTRWDGRYHDKHDPQLHGQPDRIAPPAQRWLALLVVLAVVCAIVMLAGGL